MMPSQPAPTALATPLEPDRLAVAQQAGLEFANKLGNRRLAAGAPVRNAFVSAPGGQLPPLAALLRGGGRGGQVRVKLYISLLWVCAAAPYETVHPARAWAALLGLNDYETKGVRRIHEATRDLVAAGLIQAQDRGGLPSVLRLLQESGTNEPYQPPSAVYSALRAARAPQETLQQHTYFKIPSTVWTSGLLACLSGPGLAMLLVLLCEQRGADGAGVWFTPEIAQERFKLAPSTRTAGLRELNKLGVVQTRKAPVSHDGAFINFQRYRNVHTLTFDSFTAPSS